MTAAFVLSGGGNLGAVHVGMLLALEEAGVSPDFVVGTSVGAINGSWVAAGSSAAELARVWEGLDRSDVFPLDPILGFVGFVGHSDHLVSQRRLRRLLEVNMAFDRLEDAPVPFGVVATDVLSGEDVLIDKGPAVEAVLASAAIPGVFAPVELGERWLMDGGVVNNAPISHAVASGADEVWVLAAGYACALQHPPDSALGMVLHAVSLMTQQRLALDARHYAATPDAAKLDLRIVPPLCPVSVAPTDFSQSTRLIERAYEHTRGWLASGAGMRPTSEDEANVRLSIHQH